MANDKIITLSNLETFKGKADLAYLKIITVNGTDEIDDLATSTSGRVSIFKYVNSYYIGTVYRTNEVLETYNFGLQDIEGKHYYYSSRSINPLLEDVTFADMVGSDYEIEYQSKLTFDSTPTAGHTNPVTSGGIYNSCLMKTGLEAIEIGTFNNDIIEIGDDTDLYAMFMTGGMFMFTYGNCYAFCPVNSTNLNLSTPIRVTIPVIYTAEGNANAGNLRIEKTTGGIIFRIQNVVNGFKLYVYKL